MSNQHQAISEMRVENVTEIRRHLERKNYTLPKSVQCINMKMSIETKKRLWKFLLLIDAVVLLFFFLSRSEDVNYVETIYIEYVRFPFLVQK